MSNFAKRMLLGALGCFLVTHAAFVISAENARVELSMKAEKEIIVTDDNGKQATKRIAIAVLDEQGNKSTRQIEVAVTPGDEVIYTIIYSNKSKDTATDVVISNPIPAHMIYVSNSASSTNTKLEFSVDGKHFDNAGKLTVTAADGKTRPAQAEDYTHVRWTLITPLEPGKTGQLSYRAVLE